jgi:hypothetical protein
MARTETVLRVFVSFPSDVTDEVESVERVIEELNRTALRTSGMRLEMLTWLTDVVPGVSDDVQKLINDQIRDEYDIFIGILWARFGRPTPRADSGTAEEFERAYSRYKTRPDSVRVMVYFKTSAVKLDAIDPDQIRQIQRFKSQLGEKGALYCEFETPESFDVYLRSHLAKQVQSWGREWGREAINSPSVARTISEASQADGCLEEGALDLVDSGVEGCMTATDSIARITRLFENATTWSDERVAQLRALKQSEAPNSAQEIKRTINLAAVDLDQFAKGLNEEIKILSRSLVGGLDAFSRVLTYKDCFNGEDLASLTTFGESLALILTHIASARCRNLEMTEAIAGWPRMTTLLNRAKRSAIEVLKQYDVVLAEALQLSQDAKRNYNALFSDN